MAYWSEIKILCMYILWKGLLYISGTDCNNPTYLNTVLGSCKLLLCKDSTYRSSMHSCSVHPDASANETTPFQPSGTSGRHAGGRKVFVPAFKLSTDSLNWGANTAPTVRRSQVYWKIRFHFKLPEILTFNSSEPMGTWGTTSIRALVATTTDLSLQVWEAFDFPNCGTCGDDHERSYRWTF